MEREKSAYHQHEPRGYAVDWGKRLRHASVIQDKLNDLIPGESPPLSHDHRKHKPINEWKIVYGWLTITKALGWNTDASNNLSYKSMFAHNGCEMLLDSGADTSVVGKHGFITEVIEGISVSAQGFSDGQPALDDLPVVNALYAYDDHNSGEVILLELNHSIYLGSQKRDAIACPNQLRIHGVDVDDRPTSLFPNIEYTQCVIVDGKVLPLKIRGPLSYLFIRRPTISEVQNSELQVLQLTSPHGWDPYSTDAISTQHMLHFQFGCSISTFLTKNLRILSRLSTNSKKTLTPSILAQRWGIEVETARLKSTLVDNKYIKDPN